MSKVTIGLIGYGYWGPNLMRNYIESDFATPKWVCDLSPERLEKASTRYPTLLTTTRVEDVIDDPEVDAVLIATPISSHHALAMKALQAGKHVFVEKPMATSVEECDEMCAAADEGRSRADGGAHVRIQPSRTLGEADTRVR